MPRDIDYYKAKAKKQLGSKLKDDKIVKASNDENGRLDSDGVGKSGSVVTGDDGESRRNDAEATKGEGEVAVAAAEATKGEVGIDKQGDPVDDVVKSTNKVEEEVPVIDEERKPPIPAPTKFTIDIVNPPHVALLSHQVVESDDDGVEEDTGPKFSNPLAALPDATNITEPFKAERILYLTLTTKMSSAFVDTTALHAFLNKTIPCAIVSVSSSSLRTTVKVETNKRGEFGVRNILGKKWIGGGAVWTIGGGKSKRVKGRWRGGGTDQLARLRRKTEAAAYKVEDGEDEDEAQQPAAGDENSPSKKATTGGEGFMGALDEVSDLRKREFRRISIVDVLDELKDTHDLSRVMKVWLSGGLEEYTEIMFEEESKEESKGGETKEEMKEASKEEGKREYEYDSDDSSVSSAESLTNLIIARATLQAHIYKQGEKSDVEGKFTLVNTSRSVSKILRYDVSIMDVSAVMHILGHSVRNSVTSSTYSDYEVLHKPVASMRWRWLLGKRIATEREIKGLGYDVFLKILWVFDRVKREELAQ